ncbi:PD-(D/E)XK nuclease family protein [Nonomuraea angiospora]|uniref:PD-(D/E)XK nuclease family protein n=1 Tax=Nonomuraea angiospora TaxID=46172 RepID=UPI0033D2EDBE
MEILDRIEFNSVSLESVLEDLRGRSPVIHDGHLRYAEHAVRMYRERFAGEELMPVRPYWVVQHEEDKLWELYAWWRRYESDDGSVREYRRLRHGKIKGSSPGELGIAAYVAVHGRPAAWPDPWSDRFPMLRSAQQRVRRVRIVEIGLADGRVSIEFDGSLEDAENYYRQHGHPHVAKVVSAGGLSTGASCFECKQMTGCPALPRVPGILGLPSRPAPLRKVSVSDLRYYKDCPAQAHLRALHLPKESEYSDSAKLGQAVHQWIESLHRRKGHPPCIAGDMPPSEQNWTEGRWHVPDELAEIGLRMLHHHVDACPFLAESLIEYVDTEARRAFHDTAAQVVVVAKPDLLYLDDGSWVWRELKTTQKESWFHDDLLEEFPQLALGVVALARGALGGDPSGSRVEVEVLRPEGSDLHTIDPFEPDRLEKALTVLRHYAAPWREDETFEARPSRKCQWCPVSKWCASYTPQDS